MAQNIQLRSAAAPAMIRRTDRVATGVRGQWLAFAPCVAVMALALALNTWSLSSAGYGNTYYAAATRSMTLSWSNFFFGAFDPGGYITVDKPPAFLWVGALSARIFGYSSLSILLPSAIAGAANVGLLWVIVRRYFGVTAATIAALVLALSPISVAVNRLNLPEPFMILALLGAAYAVLRSTEGGRWWAWTILAGVLVGVGFNTKMLAAWIPGPALVLAIIVAMPVIHRGSMRKLARQLAVFGAVTLVVSASWVLAVDAWPSSNRPYVGGSADNTVRDLVFGYNGVGRVAGVWQGGGPPPPSNVRAGQSPFGSVAPRSGGGSLPSAPVAPGSAPRPNPGAPFAPPGTSLFGRGGAGGAPTGSLNGLGGVFGGDPGPFRMVNPANGGQIGWLLPFAVGAGAIALLMSLRDPKRRALVVLFLGWVVLFGGVFSYAQGIMHSYYTSAMAPGVAALTGIGTVALADALRRDRRWLLAVCGLVGVTLYTQIYLENRVPEFYGWVRPMTVGVTIIGLVIVGTLTVRRTSPLAGLAVMLTGLLLLPAAWTISASANTSLNATLPQAGPQHGASGATFGSDAFDKSTTELATWLRAQNTSGTTWPLVVANSQNASRLIAEEQLSVMSLGGFSGDDRTISVAGFAGLVSTGEVRFVVAGESGRGGGGGSTGAGASAVLDAVQIACAPVSDRTLPLAYQRSVYDCRGRGGALAREDGR